MELAMIGLGKMGGNMARRLSRAGHRVVGYNRASELTLALAAEEKSVVAMAKAGTMAAASTPVTHDRVRGLS